MTKNEFCYQLWDKLDKLDVSPEWPKPNSPKLNQKFRENPNEVQDYNGFTYQTLQCPNEYGIGIKIYYKYKFIHIDLYAQDDKTKEYHDFFFTNRDVITKQLHADQKREKMKCSDIIWQNDKNSKYNNFPLAIPSGHKRIAICKDFQDYSDTSIEDTCIWIKSNFLIFWRIFGCHIMILECMNSIDISKSIHNQQLSA